jgi:ribosome-binding protein aMBF1 (putative translation factor)
MRSHLHEGKGKEEKEYQENLEVQPSKHGDPESMIPNGSEERPQKDLVTKYEEIIKRSRAKKNTYVMFFQTGNKIAHANPVQ